MNSIDLTSRGSRLIKIILQIAFWLDILILTGILRQLAEDISLLGYLKWALISFPFKWTIFYSYFYYFIPRWLNKETWKFVLITILIFVIYPEMKMYIDDELGVLSIQAVAVQMSEDQINISAGQADYWQEWLRRSITVFLNILTAFFLRFMVDWFKNLTIREQMETQHLKSELGMLRNQVNPHFLFNTLNNIDAMVYKVSAEASEAIMKLSGIMRYMLYESNVDYVTLNKEIEYIDSYFELQRMRIKKKSALSFNCDIKNFQTKIAPMIFIPFVENAFKHADFNDLFINCNLSLNDDEIIFEVVNSVSDKPMEKDITGGIGLANVQRRLELIYPKRHSLKIVQDDNTYKVELKISVNED